MAAATAAAIVSAAPEDATRKLQYGGLTSAADVAKHTSALHQFIKHAPKDKKKTSQSQSQQQQQLLAQQQRKKKEVIDYSAAQANSNDKSAAEATANTTTPTAVAVIGGSAGSGADPKSKVRSWLLASHCRVDAPPAPLPKSKSSPVNLQANPVAGLPPRPPATNRNLNTRFVILVLSFCYTIIDAASV